MQQFCTKRLKNLRKQIKLGIYKTSYYYWVKYFVKIAINQGKTALGIAAISFFNSPFRRIKKDKAKSPPRQPAGNAHQKSGQVQKLPTKLNLNFCAHNF
jgi:hypothetical protein